MRGRSSARWLAVFLVAAVACTGGTNPAPHSPQRYGGSVIVAAEGWPRCLNPITDCSFSPGFASTIEQFVFPRLVQWSNSMEPEPSPLIDQVPSLDNGGLTESPFSVTYHLNPSAVWSDGTPITCADVNFTWKAILNTIGTYSTAGYTTEGGVAGISNVACPNPRTVTLEFNKVYVDWPDLFGGTGAQAFILERAAFLAQAATDRPDLRSEMASSIPFSGGPWTLQTWSDQDAVLVRNDRYWDRKPLVDQVTFVSTTDAASEVGSLLSGEVLAISPGSPAVPLAAQIGSVPDIRVAGGDGNSVEALWFQLDRPPMNDIRVRQALAYAVDRGSVVRTIIRPQNPSAVTNDCGPWIPGQAPWCPRDGPFAAYGYDPARALALLQESGYDCSAVVSGGSCARGGSPLTIMITTLAGDVQGAATVALIQQGALAAGIRVQVHTEVPVQLFSNSAPLGAFQVALYPRGPIIDPSVTGLFSCSQIPTRANGYGGANWDHLCDRRADRLMQRIDQELDVTKRAVEVQELGRLLADDLPMLPLDVPPNVAAWRTDRIGGIDPADLSSPYGLFFGLSSWYQVG